jgi:hypothetical protein
LGILAAEIGNGMCFLGIPGELEGISVSQVTLKINTRKLTIIEHVDNHVAQGDQVVSSAGSHEVKLVQASEDHVSSEGLDLVFLDVESGGLINKASGETEVNQVKGGIGEHILLLVLFGKFVLETNHDVV